MRIRKRIVAAITCLTMVSVGLSNSFATEVKGATEAEVVAEVETKDSWVDPGNYTRGWFDVVTGRDIYGNEGTKEDPYEIKNAKDLAGLSYYTNIAATDSATTDFGGKYIDIKAKKIDLSEHYWYPIGSAQNFKGNVEGNGVTVSNMFIGRAEKYETAARVGLFGSIFGNVKDIAVKNAVIYSNSTAVGGFAGIWNGGNIENCSVEGKMSQIASSSNVGGFIGYHTNAGFSVKNCYTTVSIAAPKITGSSVGGFVGNTNTETTYSHCYATGDVSMTAGNAGGFAGYSNISTFENCMATGNVKSNGSSSVGGFIGKCDNGVQKNCGAFGNVTTVAGYAGGFSGNARVISAFNCYALGNVEGGSGTHVAGFIAYLWNHYTNYAGYGQQNDYNWNVRDHSVSMKIENCFCAGSTKTGANGTVSGFLGIKQYGWTSITLKKCYWNQTASQIINGTSRTSLQKIVNANVDSRTTVGTHQNYMQSSDFASDLNEYVYQNPSYTKWVFEENVNNNYPYLEGMKDILITIKGDEKQTPITDEESTDNMKVYGTLIFSNDDETEQPEDPEDQQISAGLKWGSLEYVYTAGDYDKETKTYAPGTWAPKEAGVTDLITVTNQTDVDIQASYTFLASLGETGIYKDLTGTFVQEDQETELDKPVFVRSKQGDIAGVQNAYLKINGVPNTQKSVEVPEVIGTVIITISKYAEPEEVPEPQPTAATEPEVSETPEEEPSQSPSEAPTDIPVVTASAEPENTPEAVTSQEPVATAPADIATPVPEQTQAPEVTDSGVTTEQPEAAQTPTPTEPSSMVEETAQPVATEAPATPAATEAA